MKYKMREIRQFSLKNLGGYVVKAGISYLGSDGIWHTPDIKNKNEPIGRSQLIVIDEYDIPDGTEVKLYAEIFQGEKKVASEKFKYRKDCDTIAYYEIKGTVWHGNNPIYVPKMEIFWIDTIISRGDSPDCKMVLISDAKEQYPRTVNLASGYWTTHPVDEYALAPIDNYFHTLEINKVYECITLLGKMGASKIHIKIEDKQEMENNSDLNVNYDEINGKINMKIMNSLSEYKDFDLQFPSINKNNLDRSNKADTELLEKSQWFKDDPEMDSIFKLWLSDNMPKTFRVTSKINKTFGFDFKMAAQYLDVPILEVKNQYKKIKTICRIIEVEFNN